MTVGHVGDRVIEETERVGAHGRSGEVIQVLGEGDAVHYRVRWEDGHESVFFPEMGSVKFEAPRHAS